MEGGLALGDMSAHTLHREYVRMKSIAKTYHENSVPSVRATFEPCPSADFNGVGLFYFAHYPEILDRIEWANRSELHRLPLATLKRSTFFYGNLEPGDSVRVEIRDITLAPDCVMHSAQLFRSSDNMLICQAFTNKMCK